MRTHFARVQYFLAAALYEILQTLESTLVLLQFWASAVLRSLSIGHSSSLIPRNFMNLSELGFCVIQSTCRLSKMEWTLEPFVLGEIMRAG